MAVVSVQVFALTDEDTALTADDQFTVSTHFTRALTTLTTTDANATEVVVISHDVHPYETGAVIYLLGMAEDPETVTDVVAAHLDSAMTGAPDLFQGWHLMAGDSAVWCADN
ncbi:hypothetical protein [Nocardiopsis nanhaiensis]